MKSMSKRGVTRQAGFTLVELVIVITILGVLAAVALPRFTSLQGDARAAKANAFAGSIKAAAAQVRAAAMVKAVVCNTASQTVQVEGSTVALINCYPVASATNGIFDAANIDDAATGNKDGVIVSFPTVSSGNPAKAVLQIAGANTPANCSVEYTEATVATSGANYTITPATVTVDVTGC
jgi:MSHA pilin protein MshA